MPIEVTELKTKSGYPVLKTHFVAEVTVADVEKYQAQTPVGRYDDHGYLVTGNVTSVSGEVKKKLSSRKRDSPSQMPVAIVLESALMRMAASLVARATGTAESETFRSEADALAWLDDQLARKRKK